MLCKSCHYPLKELSAPRCPECGTVFDPGDPQTFLSPPNRAPTIAFLSMALCVLTLLFFAMVFLDRYSSSPPPLLILVPIWLGCAIALGVTVFRHWRSARNP